MDFGVLMFCTDTTMDPRDLGRSVEEHGFESLFLPEHTHIPTDRVSPYPPGGELPEFYARTLDPFVSLAAVASVTERILVGFGACLLIQRDPIVTAKAVATLDLLSGGRVLFGVGAGWNREEMANHGTDPSTRYELLAERVGAVKAIWGSPEASYHGQYVDFDPIWCWPKPVQQPHPPILIGGDGPSAIDRTIEYGDEWMPRAFTPNLLDRIREFHQRVEEAGRPPLRVSVYGARPDDGAVEEYSAAGVSRCIFPLPSGKADQVLPLLSKLADLAARH